MYYVRQSLGEKMGLLEAPTYITGSQEHALQ
jgi:hypothetical protein